ncbi:MAG: type II secretion system F family protein [Candidatus Methylomirabilia bacterium]
MDLVLAIAGLTFLVVVTTIIGIWLTSEKSRSIRERLGYRGRVTPKADTQLLRAGTFEAGSRWGAAVRRIPLWGRLTVITEQAGHNGEVSDVFLLMSTFALIGGGGAWLRTGEIAWGALLAVIASSLPVWHLLYKRYRRLRLFERQFPDALDMLTRSMRAGYGLSQAIQVVAEEMPDPTGQEFRQVAEQIRVGLDPGEALSRLRSRVPTEDTTFFCTAVSIQRSAGGNLAEILDRLSEVIRERFKLFSHARILSSQARWTAIIVGVSPVVFAIIFQLLSPGFFDPLLNSPLAPVLIVAGLISEAIGFFLVWRIASIKV